MIKKVMTCDKCGKEVEFSGDAKGGKDYCYHSYIGGWLDLCDECSTEFSAITAEIDKTEEQIFQKWLKL